MNYHDIKVNGRIAEIFQSYDNDNSGSIDSKEFTVGNRNPKENPIREFLRKTQPLDKLVNAKDTFPTTEEVGDTNFNDLVQRYTTLKEKLTAIETMFK